VCVCARARALVAGAVGAHFSSNTPFIAAEFLILSLSKVCRSWWGC
jgi:hypothetical protein